MIKDLFWPDYENTLKRLHNDYIMITYSKKDRLEGKTWKTQYSIAREPIPLSRSYGLRNYHDQIIKPYFV